MLSCCDDETDDVADFNHFNEAKILMSSGSGAIQAAN